MENKASKNFFIAQTPVEKQEGAQKKTERVCSRGDVLQGRIPIKEMRHLKSKTIFPKLRHLLVGNLSLLDELGKLIRKKRLWKIEVGYKN